MFGVLGGTFEKKTVQRLTPGTLNPPLYVLTLFVILLHLQLVSPMDEVLTYWKERYKYISVSTVTVLAVSSNRTQKPNRIRLIDMHLKRKKKIFFFFTEFGYPVSIFHNRIQEIT